MRAPARLARWLLLALAAGLLAPAAFADEYEEVFLDRDVGRSAALRSRARVLFTGAGSRQGGYGYATVELENRDQKPHAVGIELVPMWGGMRGDGTPYRVRKSRRLEAGERATVHLPLANLQGGAQIQITWDGRRAPSEPSGAGARRRGSTLAALGVWSTAPDRAAAWISYLEKSMGRVLRGKSVTAPSFPLRRPGQLPDQWVLLSGFDLVIVDASDPELTPEHERLLLRYVAGGGNLLVFDLTADADGPLAGLHEGAETTRHTEGTSIVHRGYHGLGRFLTLSDATRGNSLDDWLTSAMSASGVVWASERPYAGGVPTGFWLPLDIPGLGKVPVQLFFWLLLAFVLVVGPLSYMYFRRRKRLPMLLVTIPALGFTCTALILLYGLFSEGFGVVAAARSFSVIDQRSHEAATCMGRTLFAGLQPSGLTPAPETFFFSGSFQLDGFGPQMSARLHVDLDGGTHIGGGALPSRTPFPIVSTTVGRARERLRFRRRPDGGFDVLAAPGFLPAGGADSLLLRTADGAYYRMSETGALAPMEGRAGQVWEVTLALRGRFLDMPIGTGDLIDQRDPWAYAYRAGRLTLADLKRMATGPDALGNWLDARFSAGLPPGSYLARMQAPAQREEFGLDIDYRAAEHLVFGLLDPEDVVDE